MAPRTPDRSRSTWTFLSNHGNVLLAVARNPDATLREVANLVGITERAVQRIIADLEAACYLERVRSGRRNHYNIHPELPLRLPVGSHRDIGALIELVCDPPPRPGV
ncbi:MarR family protein [Aquisphaera giovannonii]|uniref:MarR family protein n=2 Tax=Aquisphaera giovannonii TaxID=406548 RepID=A0A5B9VU55_9BACT|nr:MarR family protein [Aquisphaera giovannonii]